MSHGVEAFTPTPLHFASDQGYYSQAIYLDPALGYDMSGQVMMTPAGHHSMPINEHPGMMQMHPYHNQTNHPLDDCSHSPFLPEGPSPYGHPMDLPAQGPSPMMLNGRVFSQTEHLDPRHAPMHRNHSMPLIVTHPVHSFPAQRQHRAGTQQSLHPHARPPLHRNHTTQVPPRPTHLHRQASFQPIASARSASPHMMAGDIFDPMPGSPVKRPSSSLGFELERQPGPHLQQQPGHIDYGVQEMGISPARALGPAPNQPQRFSPPHDDPMITPHCKPAYEDNVQSSGTSSTVTSSSSVTSGSINTVEEKPEPAELSDEDDSESPSKGPSASRAMSKMVLHERQRSQRIPNRPQPIVVRPHRPQTGKAVTTGGRTSAKLAKVAEDPGVEGIPAGPRSMDRPGPSFACIIGQAILKSSAGGLSLEHIYRYVETAFPFFKTGDGAWRNSVRHNLSIHKMFETIPRTEKFPPGKGGIWIIHEDEKCHWPEENKFIKNFPSQHHHHGVCRQTMHERQKEKEAMDKAAREGRIYVPKKGKKGGKLPMKDEDEDCTEMMRTLSGPGSEYQPGVISRVSSQQEHHVHPPLPVRPFSITPTLQHHPLPYPSSDVPADLDDDGDFLQNEESMVHLQSVEVTPPEPVLTAEEKLARSGAMIPPRFERREKRRLEEDEENVFTSTKRVRVADPTKKPLAPIHPPPQETVRDLDDSFVTPERERPIVDAKVTSSAFRTPALVTTSSSPGSSPMPPTVTRTTHHPSALQQAWTHDDMAEAVLDQSSPNRPMLDAAFDFQPKPGKNRARILAAEDDMPPPSAINSVPKTPVSRSSAHREARTPGTALAKTPMIVRRSPAQPPPSVSALLSTPMWEMGGCLDRLQDYPASPTHSIRSPMPPTSPTRYAMLLGSGASPSSRKIRDFAL